MKKIRLLVIDLNQQARCHVCQLVSRHDGQYRRHITNLNLTIAVGIGGLVVLLVRKVHSRYSTTY